jgi:hypothetical protein
MASVDSIRIGQAKSVKTLTFKLYAAVAVLASLTSVGHAQSNTAIVRGTVTDKTGAVVSGAKVRLTNAITNYSQQAISDSQGAYRLIDVPFNDYRLTVETAGFEPATQ